MKRAWLLGVFALGLCHNEAPAWAQAAEANSLDSDADPNLASEAAGTAKQSNRRSEATSFEALLGEAMPAMDLATLMVPFLEDCTGARRQIDKARCRGMTSFLRQTMPSLTYAMIVTDGDVVSVSDYDARIKGFRLAAVGCLACKQPIAVGKGDSKRMVALRMPDKTARTLSSALDVGQVALTFEDIAAARSWLSQVRPHLRAQYVFEPSDKQWSFGPSRGFAFNLLGTRIFNHCTGEVLHSQPKSEAPAPKYSEGDECGEGFGEGAAAEGGSLPLKLAATDITRALNEIRPQLDRCHEQFALKGRAELDFTVDGATGLPQRVAIRGSLGGTALGQCLTEAARKAKFPKFRQDSQSFNYPVLFKRQ